MSSGLLALLVAAAASSQVACSKAEEPAEKKAEWSCATVQVPAGEALRCTSSAVSIPTSQIPSGDTTSAAPATDTTSDTTVSYECGGATDTLADCPPITVDGAAPVGSDGTTAGSGQTGSDGTATGDGQTGSDGTTSGGTTSGGTSGSQAGSDGTTGGKGNGNGNANGSDNGNSDKGVSSSSSSGGSSGASSGSSDSSTSHTNECEYVPDLPYCGGGGGSSTGSSSSSGGSSGGGDKGKGRHYKCTKDSAGNKSCVSTPDCAPGTHAAACGACVDDSETAGADCVPPTEGGCWVTGGGFIEAASLTPAAAADGHDNFGGNAKPMKDGHVSGHWNHVDHGTGNHSKGKPEYIMCRHVDEPGPGQPGGKKGLTANQVYFGGHAQWRTGDVWNDGYWFDVVAKDHGEPGSSAATKKGQMPDTYHFTIRKIDDAAKGVSGPIVYETKGDLNGGNIQMHPSNNGHPAVSSPLPAWVSLEP